VFTNTKALRGNDFKSIFKSIDIFYTLCFKKILGIAKHYYKETIEVTCIGLS
jgi:hypothetical protein